MDINIESSNIGWIFVGSDGSSGLIIGESSLTASLLVEQELMVKEIVKRANNKKYLFILLTILL